MGITFLLLCVNPIYKNFNYECSETVNVTLWFRYNRGFVEKLKTHCSRKVLLISVSTYVTNTALSMFLLDTDPCVWFSILYVPIGGQMSAHVGNTRSISGQYI